MVNILLLVPRMNIGGAESYVFAVAQELKLRGYNVFVASGGGKLADNLSAMGIKTFFVPVRFNKHLAAFLLKRLVNKYKIDIIHANSGAAGEVATLVKRATGAKVVYTAHGVFGNLEREYIINEVDKIVCVSDCVKQRALQQKFTPGKLVTCYSGIDLEKFTPDDKIRESLRHEFNIEPNTLTLIIVSRIKNLKHKGHESLLKIFDEYARQENWKLIVVGKGNGLLKLKLAIKRKHLQDKIICLGHRTDVNRIMNAADVLVLPSGFETFGLVLAEAMAMGKPAISYAVGGTPEVIKDSETGYLVDYLDVETLYEKIKYLDTHRDKLSSMSLAGRKWIADNFTNKKMVDDLEIIYQEVLAE